jgi:cbb3-type cytochrome oxidase subunit 3
MSWFEIAGTLRPLGLVVMTLLFVALAWRALAPSRRKAIEEAARIPLVDDR